ncbi:ABC transporter ATP-binding protein [Thorsellia anophelis]|uniref:ATP-binding cassette, subfamily B, multidrug efflux pump n=1 Tax=Thorsellia anophelis DSM 18579 TaxID=1123402 RepID=A0A1H9YU93_9GAMM|nr:ABC transporter ATP-binding protein [Thorsellia anophelis]SES72655.1 ATP-binding cassette, subfamily B, multidrug efflux pump [Thorsellia anophelis DSM 18579]
MFNWFEQKINPFPDNLPKRYPTKLIPFIWACSSGIRRYIFIMSLFTAAVGIFEAVLFSFLGNVIDWLSETKPEDLWAKEGHRILFLLIILLISPLLVGVQSLIKHQTLMGNYPMRLRWLFHRQMLNQSMGFYQNEFAGRISTKVLQTALAARDVTMIFMDILVFVGIYFVTILLVVGNFSLLMLIPFLVWLFFYAAANIYFVPRLGKVAKRQADARSLMSGRITDAYTNISTVKLFSHANREADFAKNSMKEFMQSVYAQMRLVTGFYTLDYALCAFLTIATASMGLILWSQGIMGVGAVAASIALALRLNGMSQWIMWEMSNLFENIGTVQDGLQILSRQVEIKDKPNANSLIVSKGEVIFKEVEFSYGGEKEVIKSLNLQIKPGEKIGLVGRSGAGKSTLLNLLLRFYDVDSGSILIDGQSIADVSQSSLRQNIGMVTQDTSLLHRSVKDNLTYGRPDATEDQIMEAAKNAHAHEFITELSDHLGRKGYEAHVGERGVKLSGGQRQRIAIARVMLKDAPILLLDEATSALDSEVEIAIQESLYRLMEGKTVIAIAHRLSTIAAMDRLIVMDKGEIIESGSHNELIEQNGMYAQLWRHQSGGFLASDDNLDNE